MNLEAFRNALVAVYDADAAVQAITGRTILNLTPWGSQHREVNLPVTTYHFVAAAQAKGTKGHALITVQVQPWASDETAGVFASLEGLMDRAEALFNGPSLAAQGIDVSVNSIVNRGDVGPEDGVRGIRADFLFDYTI